LIYCSPVLKARSVKGATVPIPSAAMQADSVDTFAKNKGKLETRPLSEPGCESEFFFLSVKKGVHLFSNVSKTVQQAHGSLRPVAALT
jgi:hypothetical protein